MHKPHQQLHDSPSPPPPTSLTPTNLPPPPSPLPCPLALLIHTTVLLPSLLHLLPSKLVSLVLTSLLLLLLTSTPSPPSRFHLTHLHFPPSIPPSPRSCLTYSHYCPPFLSPPFSSLSTHSSFTLLSPHLRTQQPSLPSYSVHASLHSPLSLTPHLLSRLTYSYCIPSPSLPPPHLLHSLYPSPPLLLDQLPCINVLCTIHFQPIL